MHALPILSTIRSIIIYTVATVSFAMIPKNSNGQHDSLEGFESILAGYNNSPIRYYSLADSYSSRLDTVNAELYLLKVDPYYLIWEWRNSTLPDTFLKKLAIHSYAKKQVLAKYFTLLNGTKSKAYLQFDKYAQEDQILRKKLSNCKDSTECTLLARKMHEEDSLHFASLYSYVSKYGWPSLSNGSLNACLIAIHDHRHHSYYLPFIRSSVKKGESPLSVLQLINFWTDMSESDKIQQLIIDTTTKKFSYDITEVLDLKMPYALAKIQKVVRSHCPVKIRFVFYCSQKSIYDEWFEKYPPAKSNHIITNIIDALNPDCPKKIPKGVWDVRYQPSEETKLMLYILY